MINNDFCQYCIKNSICTWYDKLNKLEKKTLLDLTVDGCQEFVDNELDETNSDNESESDESEVEVE